MKLEAMATWSVDRLTINVSAKPVVVAPIIASAVTPARRIMPPSR